MRMKNCLAMILAAVMLLAGCAQADEVFLLPENTTEIGAQAFLDSDMTHVILPAGLELENIGAEAFPKGTMVEGEQEGLREWAEENGYTTPSRRFALLIGQTYEGAKGFEGSVLTACSYDADAMAAMLSRNSGIPYRTTVAKNLTRAGILAAIRSAFADAKENDVCLFFYSGHGMSDTGDLVPTDLYSVYKGVTMSELRSALDQVKGTKIVILDSCFSGNLVLEMGGTVVKSLGETSLDAIGRNMIRAFASGWTPRGDGTPEYVVITACRHDETSGAWGDASVFTYYFLEGSGYDMDYHSRIFGMPADADEDSAISHAEAYRYAKAETEYYEQSVQAYPTGGCDFILWTNP